MFDWKSAYNQQIRLREQVDNNPNVLRFEKKSVYPSEIGSQYYCEQKVELAYIYGTTETQEIILGTEGHEKAVEDFTIVDMEQIWQHISKEGWRWIAETPFIMKYDNVYIIGMPDQILFINSKPNLLFEFKFSKYSTTFPDQHAQAEAYGLLLKECGFDTSSLFYVIMVIPMELRDSNALKELPKKIAQMFFEKNLFMQSRSEFQWDEINIFIQQFDPYQAEKNMNHALEYWLQKREAEGTDNPNKCRSCELRQHCQYKKI